MSTEVIETYIQQCVEAQQADEVHFAWQGGEPTLLGIDYFRKIIELERKYAGGKRIHNAFQTNGVLLDEAWGEFLAENHFLVGLSIDGPRELHDHFRVDKGGQPSFDRVICRARVLKKHGVEFNTLTVVQRENSLHPLEAYRFLKEIGSGYLQFIPIVERMANSRDQDGLVLIGPGYIGSAEVSPWSVELHQFGCFQCNLDSRCRPYAFQRRVRTSPARLIAYLFNYVPARGIEYSACTEAQCSRKACVIYVDYEDLSRPCQAYRLNSQQADHPRAEYHRGVIEGNWCQRHSMHRDGNRFDQSSVRERQAFRQRVNDPLRNCDIFRECPHFAKGRGRDSDDSPVIP